MFYLDLLSPIMWFWTQMVHRSCIERVYSLLNQWFAPIHCIARLPCCYLFLLCIQTRWRLRLLPRQDPLVEGFLQSILRPMPTFQTYCRISWCDPLLNFLTLLYNIRSYSKECIFFVKKDTILRKWKKWYRLQYFIVRFCDFRTIFQLVMSQSE